MFGCEMLVGGTGLRLNGCVRCRVTSLYCCKDILHHNKIEQRGHFFRHQVKAVIDGQWRC